jgi:hypothetical protein
VRGLTPEALANRRPFPLAKGRHRNKLRFMQGPWYVAHSTFPTRAALSDEELLAVLLGSGSVSIGVVTLAEKLTAVVGEKGLNLRAEDLKRFGAVTVRGKCTVAEGQNGTPSLTVSRKACFRPDYALTLEGIKIVKGNDT